MRETHPRIRVDVRREGNTDFVEVAGEIDLATAPHLDEVLSDLSAPKLVIDMTGVDFIDSSGLHALIKARARYDGDERIRLIVKRPGRVVRLLELADLAGGFAIDEVSGDGNA